MYNIGVVKGTLVWPQINVLQELKPAKESGKPGRKRKAPVSEVPKDCLRDDCPMSGAAQLATPADNHFQTATERIEAATLTGGSSLDDLQTMESEVESVREEDDGRELRTDGEETADEDAEVDDEEIGDNEQEDDWLSSSSEESRWEESDVDGKPLTIEFVLKSVRS